MQTRRARAVAALACSSFCVGASRARRSCTCDLVLWGGRCSGRYLRGTDQVIKVSNYLLTEAELVAGFGRIQYGSWSGLGVGLGQGLENLVPRRACRGAWRVHDRELGTSTCPLGATEINLVRDGATLRWVSASRAPRFCRRLAVSWLFRPTRRGGGANV